MLVQFKKTWRMYQPGEVAGFEPEVAQPLIAGGFAVDAEAMVEDASEGATDAPDPAAKPKPKPKPKPKAEALPVQGGVADTVAGGGADTVSGEGADTVAGGGADTVSGEGADTVAGA